MNIKTVRSKEESSGKALSMESDLKAKEIAELQHKLDGLTNNEIEQTQGQ